MKAFLGHLRTINHHKWLVMKLCFKIGLYRQGILHDLSKYMPSEFLSGIRYYQGFRSPNAKEREVKGYSFAWLHHKGRNKHHWEFWVDFTTQGAIPTKMPKRYVLEMFCDRVAASKTYQKEKYHDGSAFEYYDARKQYYVLDQEAMALLEHLLVYLKDHGEEETCRYIKKEVK